MLKFFWLPVTENQWHLYAALPSCPRHYVGNVTKKVDNCWIATMRPHYGINYQPAGTIHTCARWMQEAVKARIDSFKTQAND